MALQKKWKLWRYQKIENWSQEMVNTYCQQQLINMRVITFSVPPLPLKCPQHMFLRFCKPHTTSVITFLLIAMKKKREYWIKFCDKEFYVISSPWFKVWVRKHQEARKWPAEMPTSCFKSASTWMIMQQKYFYKISAKECL